MRLALYQPDIPQNAGAMLRTAACLGVAVDIIEPCGFLWSGRHVRRAGLDYLDAASVRRHVSWQAFRQACDADTGLRLVLLTTRGITRYTDHRFNEDDILLVGRETGGVPEEVHAAAAARLIIPMAAGMRSLNVSVAAAMALGEALRQTGGFRGTRPGADAPST